MSLDPPPLNTRFWRIKPPMSFLGTEAESLRFSLARDESYLKALDLWCYLFGFLWSGLALHYSRLLYLHQRDTILAPWITEPFWIATISLDVLIAGLALAAGHGLWRLRNWSLIVGMAYGVLFLF